MTYPPYVKEKARALRTERRLTIDEIAERLSVSRTTAYYWVGDLEIQRDPSKPPADAARRKGNRSMQEKYRALRDAAYRQGWGEYPDLIQQPTFRDFVCMYIAEGYKRNRNKVSICNSDPHVIWLGDHWLRRFAENRISYALQYHADQDLPRLQRFWAAGVGVAPDQIRLQRKSNSNQLRGRSWRSRFGVLTISAGDTQLRMRLEAWMNRLQDGWLDSLYAGV